MVKYKSFGVAQKIIQVYKLLMTEKKEYIISKQRMRSVILPGFILSESEQVESKADFIYKISIGFKEAKGIECFLELFYQSVFFAETIFISASNDLKEILVLLISKFKTSNKK